ncbi:unnamed protein product [Arabis nemorensis]|uniref:Uncharacterized protein n=1 Tax=Arabis nemorensis TaxID=586526 RepID=A0A565CWF6_9BRAS|nr:unnamed protein product [Arabis nemorensis]
MATMKHLANYKLVFLGDQSVGKTSIITAFIKPLIDVLALPYAMLIDISYIVSAGRDTAGQERFKSLIPSYIRDSSVALIVYDVANKESFLNTSKWIEDVRAERGNHVIIVLVGNKTDLVNKRQISTEEGDNKAREFGALFIETSAKIGFNIKPLFSKIASELQGIETVA